MRSLTDRRARPPIITGQDPIPGFYAMRLVRHGPIVAGQIIKHDDGTWSVMQDGVVQGPAANPWSLPLMESVSLATPATMAEVQYRVGLKRWAEIYQPDHPAAKPREPIDPADLPVVY